VQSLSVERGRVRKLETGMLPAGTYDFSLAGSGNADLFVKIGSGATSRSFTCKSEGPTAAEQCTVSLEAPSNVSVAVRAKTAVAVQFKVAKR
jgi:bacterial leucyl aminopeptidase